VNATHDPFTANTAADDAGARLREARALSRWGLALAVSFAIALGVLVWLIVSSSVADVSASAGAAAAPPPHVPYFPSLYVNQATEVVPTPPTF
jgi:hypothetical protein